MLPLPSGERRELSARGSGTVTAAAGEDTTGHGRASADGPARHGYERIIGRGAQRLPAAAVGTGHGEQRDGSEWQWRAVNGVP